jgi:hypothetical protein
MVQGMRGASVLWCMIRSIILVWTPKSYFTHLPLAILFINNLTKHYKFNNMQFKSINMLSDFMQVLNSTRKHLTKNECFPMLILFTTIYLLLEQKLNYVNYSDHEMNMSNFCTSYWAWFSHVCKIWRFDLSWIFVSKYSKFWFLGILYKVIMYKMDFGQAYWINLLQRIIRKLIWYFSEFCTIYYEFLKFKRNSGVFNSEMNFLEINNCMNSVGLLFGPRLSTAGLAQWLEWLDGPSRSVHGVPVQCAVTALGTGAVARLPPARWRPDRDSVFMVSSTETWVTC